MSHHSRYPYINNQCSSLVDVTYANCRCHEPERIDVSIGGSISDLFGFRIRSESELLLVTHPNDNHSPGPVIRFGSLDVYRCK